MRWLRRISGIVWIFRLHRQLHSSQARPRHSGACPFLTYVLSSGDSFLSMASVKGLPDSTTQLAGSCYEA